MLLRDYLKLGSLSLADMLAKLQAAADPEELDSMHRSSINRHASGAQFPSARLQALYTLATERAVMPEDHVKARNDFLAKSKEGEEEYATQT